MQPLAVGPRTGMSAASVAALIQDSGAVEFSAGAELLDMNLNVMADISAMLEGGRVGRQSYADLHGSAEFTLEGELDWGTAIVRPYMVMASTTTTARFNLGAYFTQSDETVLGSDPTTYAVTGVDILDVLNDPVGEAYAVAAGTTYLSAVETILQNRGVTQYLIDQSGAAVTLPSPKVWELDESTTWLNVVNDLVGAIGYRGVWSDWDGMVRVQPYMSPADRPSEWTYTVDPATAMHREPRTIARERYRAPNRWVFYRTNGVDGPPPVEGAGVYTVTNQTSGPTSVQGRAGRVITRPVGLDAADQQSLVDAGRKTVDADMRNPGKLKLSTFPNPLHWHFDRVTMQDPALRQTAMVVASWSLPLNGDDMDHEWSEIDPGFWGPIPR